VGQSFLGECMVREIATIRLYMKPIMLILCFGLFSCSTTEDQNGYQENSSLSAKELFDQGVELEQRGELDKALYHYVQILQDEPDNAPVLMRIAHIHDRRGNKSIASRVYLEALEMDPTLTYAHQGLGIIKLDQRKYKQAQSYLQQAISLDQKRLSETKEKKEAGYYALDNNSPIKSYNASGIIEDMNRNYDLARTYYQLSLGANENSARILSNIGYSYYLTGQLNLAERYYRKAIDVNANFKRAWTNLGLVYVRKGQYNRAIKTFKQVMSEFAAYNDLGYFIMLDGELDDAEYFFQKAIDLSPSYYQKAYSNLEQVQMKKRELWLLKQEAQGEEVSEQKSQSEAKVNEVVTQKKNLRLLKS